MLINRLSLRNGNRPDASAISKFMPFTALGKMNDIDLRAACTPAKLDATGRWPVRPGRQAVMSTRRAAILNGAARLPPRWQTRIDMKLTVGALLTGVMFAAGCAGAPRADFAYRGNGDARILKFMGGNYMSATEGLARFLTLHLLEGLPPGRVIDKPYLIERGAVCSDATPVVCTFSGVVDEHFSSMPKENARRAHRVTHIDARVLLRDVATVEVTKKESYPDVNET